jgi:coenzyme PQQ precursor peptide PqqA
MHTETHVPNNSSVWIKPEFEDVALSMECTAYSEVMN